MTDETKQIVYTPDGQIDRDVKKALQNCSIIGGRIYPYNFITGDAGLLVEAILLAEGMPYGRSVYNRTSPELFYFSIGAEGTNFFRNLRDL